MKHISPHHPDRPMAPFGWACVLLGLCAGTATAQDMPLTQVLIEGQGWELVAEGYRFTEGPAAAPDGSVYFSDVPASVIYRIDPQGKAVTVFARNTAKTNGLMFGPDGKLYGCRNGDRQIGYYDAQGAFTAVADGVSSNDLVVLSTGEIYFTDPAGRRVWYIPKGGKPRVVAEGYRPNGVIAWPDEGTLVVTDSDHPHLWAYRIESNGTLAYGERYYLPLQVRIDTSGPEPVFAKPGSDGMAVDDAGRLYVATRVGLQMFDPTGRLGGTILKPQEKWLSNVTFGGPQFDYLYVTCTDRVYRRKVKPRGTPVSARARLRP